MCIFLLCKTKLRTKITSIVLYILRKALFQILVFECHQFELKCGFWSILRSNFFQKKNERDDSKHERPIPVSAGRLSALQRCRRDFYVGMDCYVNVQSVDQGRSQYSFLRHFSYDVSRNETRYLRSHSTRGYLEAQAHPPEFATQKFHR